MDSASSLIEQFRRSSQLSGGSAPYVEGLYEDWLADAGSVSPEWGAFFEQLRQRTFQDNISGMMQYPFSTTRRVELSLGGTAIYHEVNRPEGYTSVIGPEGSVDVNSALFQVLEQLLHRRHRDALPPLVVADQQLGARVRQPVGKLVPRPPGVERHANRPDGHRGEEGHRPFGQVAHRQRHPVARPEALVWALERGSRSGRVAYQFARDWAGRNAKKK